MSRTGDHREFSDRDSTNTPLLDLMAEHDRLPGLRIYPMLRRSWPVREIGMSEVAALMAEPTQAESKNPASGSVIYDLVLVIDEWSDKLRPPFLAFTVPEQASLEAKIRM
jgi:hypothetical protein